MTELKYLAWLILVALVFSVGKSASGQETSASRRKKGEMKNEGSALGSAKGAPEASAQAAQTTASASEQRVDPRQGAAQLKSGTNISTELETTLDASKAKPGDEVVAKVTKDVKQDGRVVIKKGDRLSGHVTSASADSSGKASSEMSVVFDRLSRGVAVVNLNTTVSSIVSTSGDLRGGDEPMMSNEPVMARSQGAARSGGSASSSGRLVGGLTSTAGSTVNAAGSAVGGGGSTVGSATNLPLGGAGSAVGANARAAGQGNGATGLSTPTREIRLGSSAGADQSTDMTSVLSSRQGNLRLESGTQMRFRVAAQSDTKAQKQ